MTARGSRGIFSTPDAVSDLQDFGDRLDRLERIPATSTTSLVDAYAWGVLELPGDGSLVYAGRIVVPAGHSRMQYIGTFEATSGTLSSAGVVFEDDFESRNIVAGGITSGTTIGVSWNASGFALLRSTGTKRVRFYARAATSGGAPALATGALLIDPVRSVSTT